MPRFVILRHEMPENLQRSSHFDLMFEAEEGLRTWSVDTLPSAGAAAVLATPLPIHRAAYLDYQGEVSGNRGTVQRIASGRYDTIRESDSRLEMRVESETIAGILVFERGLAWLEE